MAKFFRPPNFQACTAIIAAVGKKKKKKKRGCLHNETALSRSIPLLHHRRCVFPPTRGADAKTVQDTVTQIIEQNMNGIDNLMYMSSHQ